LKFKSIVAAVFIAFLVSACETSITDFSLSNQTNSTLIYSGGLNVSFDKDIWEFLERVKTIHQANDVYILDIQFNVKTLNKTQRQQASVQLDIPFTSNDGIFPVGNYILTQEQIKAAFGNYELRKYNSDFARYNFEGVSASLVIEESSSEKIRGNFILNLEQLSGKRMIDGQLEDIILKSPIRLISQFDLKY